MSNLDKYHNKLKETKRNFRERVKAIKRRNKFQNFNTVSLKINSFEIKSDKKIIEKDKNGIFKQFSSFINPGFGDVVVNIPKNFSFCTHYSDCLQVIKDFANSMYDNLGNTITIDFGKCQKLDTSALFLLQIVRLEILDGLQLLQNKLKAVNVIPEITVKVPKSKEVIRLLLINGYPVSPNDTKDLDDDSTLTPLHNMGYLKGSSSQKHYLENKKSVFTSRIVKYLNICLDNHGYILTDTETNNIDGIISEVLSNAEDHSGTKNWFITANFSKELSQIGDEEVGEMNLTIMNFGNSIFDAFIETKDKNVNMYEEVNSHVQTMFNKNANLNFSIEQLFTLATMQDQVSRLKFERQSRGTGTMKFINSFLALGDFEDQKKGFVPNLSIFTGNVHLICDNTFQPFLKEDVYCLSLNPEQDLLIPPRETHLKKLSEKFPGTLLSVKIYLNKKHLDSKYGGNGHERN